MLNATWLQLGAVSFKLFIMKQSLVLAIALAFASSGALAQDATPEFADYSAGLAISPFGPSINLTYNVDTKNSISVGFGALPEGDVPNGFLPDFDPLLLPNVSVTGSSSWMGLFWRHRPFDNQNLGVNVGLASGQIENNFTADGFHPDESVSYSVNYTENPVVYFGLNYGLKPVKGFQFGVDLGVLSTGGADIQYTGEAEELAEHGDDIADAMAEIKDNFAWTMLPNIQVGVAYGF